MMYHQLIPIRPPEDITVLLFPHFYSIWNYGQKKIDGFSQVRYESDIIIINYSSRIVISWRHQGFGGRQEKPPATRLGSLFMESALATRVGSSNTP